jgi:hypothetical protein
VFEVHARTGRVPDLSTAARDISAGRARVGPSSRTGAVAQVAPILSGTEMQEISNVVRALNIYKLHGLTRIQPKRTHAAVSPGPRSRTSAGLVIQPAVAPLQPETEMRRTVGVLNVPRVFGISTPTTILVVPVSLGYWRMIPGTTRRRKMPAGLSPAISFQQSAAPNATPILVIHRPVRRGVDVQSAIKRRWKLSLADSAVGFGSTLLWETSPTFPPK